MHFKNMICFFKNKNDFFNVLGQKSVQIAKIA